MIINLLDALKWLGLLHYTLKFNEQGCRKKNCIDFDMAGAHLVQLDKACKSQRTAHTAGGAEKKSCMMIC